MLQFIKNIFKNEKKSKIKEETNFTLKSELLQAEKKAKEDRHRVENLKSQIYSAAADIIHEIYDVPADFWYEEYANYDLIKNDARNETVSESLKYKCDEIIKGYGNQLKLTQSKIEFYDSLIEEYRKLRTNLTKSLKKVSSQRKQNELLYILEKHKDNIGNIHQNQFAAENMFLNEEQFKIIKEELQKTYEELAIKKQVSKEIEPLLEQDYGIEKPYIDDYDKEIKKLTDKVKGKETSDEKGL